MNVKYYISGIVFSCCIVCIYGCKHRRQSDITHFTKLDSLTETYLVLKDSLLETWNGMINDDNQKIKAMQNVLHELEVSNPSERDKLKSYQERLEHLARLRYTQKTIGNAQLVEEYDFASNSLVSELISLAESQKEFAYNTTLQKLTEAIRTADQRVNNYRLDYDRIASEYNHFIETNKLALKEIDEDSFLEKRPLFQMASDEE